MQSSGLHLKDRCSTVLPRSYACGCERTHENRCSVAFNCADLLYAGEF